LLKELPRLQRRHPLVFFSQLSPQAGPTFASWLGWPELRGLRSVEGQLDADETLAVHLELRFAEEGDAASLAERLRQVRSGPQGDRPQAPPPGNDAALPSGPSPFLELLQHTSLSHRGGRIDAALHLSPEQLQEIIARFGPR
jgi:hypothetical protein